MDSMCDLSGSQAGEDDDDDGSMDLVGSQSDDNENDNDDPMIIQRASKRLHDTEK